MADQLKPMTTRRPGRSSERRVMPASASGWVRSIIEILQDGPYTADDVAQELGTRFPTALQVPVEDYLAYLVVEKLVESGDKTQHFQLTGVGRIVLDGINASPGSNLSK